MSHPGVLRVIFISAHARMRWPEILVEKRVGFGKVYKMRGEDMKERDGDEKPYLKAMFCRACGYRRGNSSGQAKTKCPHGHGDLELFVLVPNEHFVQLVYQAGNVLVENAAPVQPAGYLREPGEREALREKVVLILYDVADHISVHTSSSTMKLIVDRILALTRPPAAADGLREELALYKEAWEAHHSYGHKQGIASPQAQRLREAEAAVKAFREAALGPRKKGSV